MKNIRNYTFRVNDELWEKFHLISKKNKRSVNNQLEWIVEAFVETYEKENGEIHLDSEQ